MCCCVIARVAQIKLGTVRSAASGPSNRGHLKKKKSVSESQVPQVLLSHPTNRTEGLARLAESAAGTKPCSNTHVKSVNSCYQTALKGFSAAGHTSVAAAALGASLGHGLRLVALGGFCQASRL